MYTQQTTVDISFTDSVVTFKPESYILLAIRTVGVNREGSSGGVGLYHFGRSLFAHDRLGWEWTLGRR